MRLCSRFLRQNRGGILVIALILIFGAVIALVGFVNIARNASLAGIRIEEKYRNELKAAGNSSYFLGSLETEFSPAAMTFSTSESRISWNSARGKTDFFIPGISTTEMIFTGREDTLEQNIVIDYQYQLADGLWRSYGTEEFEPRIFTSENAVLPSIYNKPLVLENDFSLSYTPYIVLKDGDITKENTFYTVDADTNPQYLPLKFLPDDSYAFQSDRIKNFYVKRFNSQPAGTFETTYPAHLTGEILETCENCYLTKTTAEIYSHSREVIYLIGTSIETNTILYGSNNLASHDRNLKVIASDITLSGEIILDVQQNLTAECYLPAHLTAYAGKIGTYVTESGISFYVTDLLDDFYTKYPNVILYYGNNPVVIDLTQIGDAAITNGCDTTLIAGNITVYGPESMSASQRLNLIATGNISFIYSGSKGTESVVIEHNGLVYAGGAVNVSLGNTQTFNLTALFRGAVIADNLTITNTGSSPGNKVIFSRVPDNIGSSEISAAFHYQAFFPPVPCSFKRLPSAHHKYYE
ncbi:MAG: hypothetical protein PHW04_11295 [Candidatus Wallbacteria bacterium]|nr:hypothetical protein [Candidatus Wallbacteria bacterium]